MSHSHPGTSRTPPVAAAAFAALLGAASPQIHAGDYSLAIQPVLGPERTLEIYQPLADYLSDRTGHTIRIETSRDFYSYWTRMNRDEFDFVLDAAHFTGYRVKNLAYQVLAAMPDTVSYTLVSRADDLIFSSSELVGRPVASMGPPSLGAIRLEQLYANPMREPLFRTAATATEAAAMVRDGHADAAMLPTPMVGQFDDLHSIQVSEPTPHVAVSGSPHVPLEVRIAIEGALTGMSRDPRGTEVLAELRFPGFEHASSARYLPYAALIEGSRAKLAGQAEVQASDLALAGPED